jgi:hypothetical protein
MRPRLIMVCAAASGAYEAKRAERKEGTSRKDGGWESSEESSEESLEKGRCVTCKRTVTVIDLK